MNDWAEFRKNLHATYHGGYTHKETEKECHAFHHGIDTAINVIEDAFKDKDLFEAAPELHRACTTLLDWALNGQKEGMLGRAVLLASKAIHKSNGEGMK